MITEKIKEYLLNWPNLYIEGESIKGFVEFIGSYNKSTGIFTTGETCTSDDPNTTILHCFFEISVSERIDKGSSKLPALRIIDVDPNPERHINKNDQTACLCSALEEDMFLYPEFDFEKYFKELIIPFLYAQLYFSINRKWPWNEYSHGAIGVLESYGDTEDSSKARECLRLIKRDPSNWIRIKKSLEFKQPIKGHSPCFCGMNKDQIRRCHPRAFRGIVKLKKDMIDKLISLEDTSLSVTEIMVDSYVKSKTKVI